MAVAILKKLTKELENNHEFDREDLLNKISIKCDKHHYYSKAIYSEKYDRCVDLHFSGAKRKGNDQRFNLTICYYDYRYEVQEIILERHVDISRSIVSSIIRNLKPRNV